MHLKSPSKLITGKLTLTQTNENHCDQSENGVPLTDDQFFIYINDLPVNENTKSYQEEYNFAKILTIKNNEYQLSGTIYLQEGRFILNSTPPLPAGTTVTIEGTIDSERLPCATHEFENKASTVTLKINENPLYFTHILNPEKFDENLFKNEWKWNLNRHFNCINRWAINSSYEIAKNNPRILKTTRKHLADNLNNLLLELSFLVGPNSHIQLFVEKRTSPTITSLRDFQTATYIKENTTIRHLGSVFNNFEVFETSFHSQNENFPKILCIACSTDPSHPNPFIFGYTRIPSLHPYQDPNFPFTQKFTFHSNSPIHPQPHEFTHKSLTLIKIEFEGN